MRQIPRLLFILACGRVLVNGIGNEPTRLRLLKDLKSNYTRSIRLQKEPTVITLDPALYGIVDVNEARESVVVAQWFELQWTDSLLAWNPDEYDDIKVLRVLQEEIWIPDITIYQLLESSRQGGASESFVTVSYDGTVFLSRTEQITFSCAFDVSQFPNDRQNCTLTYVTWAYPSDEIIMQPASSPKARDKHYRVSSAIQRKPFYYIITLTVPSFFITNLALVGVFSPSMADQQRGEKVTIGLTALLTMAVILMMVSDLMPKNASSFPKLGMYILWEMLLMVVSTVLAVLFMYLHSFEKFGRPIPWICRWLFFIGDRKWPGFWCPECKCRSRNKTDCSMPWTNDRSLPSGGMTVSVSDLPNGYGSDHDVHYCNKPQPNNTTNAKLTYTKLCQNEATIVGEKLATYGDDVFQDLLQGTKDNGSARMARRMMVVHRHILIKVNEIHDQVKKRLLDEELALESDTQWTVLMFRLDLVGLFLTVGANCVVTYWFSGSWAVPQDLGFDESQYSGM